MKAITITDEAFPLLKELAIRIDLPPSQVASDAIAFCYYAVPQTFRQFVQDKEENECNN